MKAGISCQSLHGHRAHGWIHACVEKSGTEEAIVRLHAPSTYTFLANVVLPAVLQAVLLNVLLAVLLDVLPAVFLDVVYLDVRPNSLP